MREKWPESRTWTSSELLLLSKLWKMKENLEFSHWKTVSLKKIKKMETATNKRQRRKKAQRQGNFEVRSVVDLFNVRSTDENDVKDPKITTISFDFMKLSSLVSEVSRTRTRNVVVSTQSNFFHFQLDEKI